MMENVVMVLFNVESEAYQAFAELKRKLVNSVYTISQMALVKKQNGRIVPCESIDSGADTMDDTAIGGLVGGLAGILGGPIGMLLGGSIGLLVGSIKDADDADKNLSMFECISEKMLDEQVGLIALIQETEESCFDSNITKFQAEILRWDAAVIAAEVEEAQKLEKEMQRTARERMRVQKKEEFKQELEEKRSKLHAEFEAFKAKFKKE